VLIERSMHPDWLSNSFAIADREGGTALFVDSGADVGPLVAALEAWGAAPAAILRTHSHHDHVVNEHELRARYGIEVVAEPGEWEWGGLRVRGVATPGHSDDMVAFLADDVVFTGDTLFKNSVGGVRAPGHTSYTDLRDSIMGTLMELPPDTVIYPGHAESSTVDEEWNSNQFIRVWRGVDAEGAEPCTALGEPATLVLLADDYDGGKKAWVRWPDGSDDIVPGSRVEAKE
jgi:hydroxyacylglutathione hydrolase